MAGVTVRESIESDIPGMVLSMRRLDQMECCAVGRTPMEALEDGLEGVSCYTALIDNGIFGAMFGLYEKAINEDGLTVGTIWLLGAEILIDRPKTFLRALRRWLPIVAEDCDVLHNAVFRENLVHIRFLEHLGFTVHHDAPNPKFAPFSMDMTNV